MITFVVNVKVLQLLNLITVRELIRENLVIVAAVFVFIVKFPTHNEASLRAQIVAQINIYGPKDFLQLFSPHSDMYVPPFRFIAPYLSLIGENVGETVETTRDDEIS